MKDWTWEELINNTWEQATPTHEEEVDFLTEGDPLADLMPWNK